MSAEAPTGNEDFIDALLALSFSPYEARCYVGLLSPGPQTGYGVSKTTGVPQPKVYETLRKLVSRGAARQLPGEPVHFVAIPPGELLDGLHSSFDSRLAHARTVSTRLEVAAAPPIQEPVSRLPGRADVVKAAASVIDAATRRIYLSATSNELASLRTPIQSCVKRGVDVVVLCFGEMPFQSQGVRVFRHASTQGAVFRHHQARHIALVVDSRRTIFGLAPDGHNWSGIDTGSELVIAAVKGYIRHDIDLQQIFGDFTDDLLEAYGPGLQQLESYRADVASTSGAAANSSQEARTG